AREFIARTLGKKKPFAARNWLKTLRGFMEFVVAENFRADDPTQGVKLPRANAGGFHTWTEAEIVSGHLTLGEVERYTKAVDQAQLARQAFAIEQRRTDVG